MGPGHGRGLEGETSLSPGLTITDLLDLSSTSESPFLMMRRTTSRRICGPTCHPSQRNLRRPHRPRLKLKTVPDVLLGSNRPRQALALQEEGLPSHALALQRRPPSLDPSPSTERPSPCRHRTGRPPSRRNLRWRRDSWTPACNTSMAIRRRVMPRRASLRQRRGFWSTLMPSATSCTKVARSEGMQTRG